MCVKIVKSKKTFKYDVSKPLEEQLDGSTQVLINYDPKDSTFGVFLDEIERLCKNGISAKLNIKFNHNNHLNGAKLKKEFANASKKMDLNEVIKAMVVMQHEADKKLAEIVNYCVNEDCREQS